MPVVHKVGVALGPRSYDIVIGSALLADPATWSGNPASDQALVVTNDTVGPLYLQALQAGIRSRHRQVHALSLRDGEQYKTAAALEPIYDALLQSACDRQTVLYALGGGVVGDITGFAAACYMRGVPFVQVPTTLLAQVDSSVGGKTGINHPRGKNMIGAFHQPARVVCDLDTLQSLPARELSAGLAEVIKYGPIRDPGFLDWIESHIDALLARDPVALAYAVRRSCEIKAEVVGSDERESGERAILNFGHTFGHAFEAGLGYGQWLHGEAVGCGMVVAARLSQELGLLDPRTAQRLTRLIGRAGLPVRPPDSLDTALLLSLMQTDKKALQGQVRFVLITDQGRALVRPVEMGLAARAIDACRRADPA